MNGVPRYSVHILEDYAAALPLLTALADRMDTGLPFQDPLWLSLWYRSFSPTGIRPLIAIVTEGPVLDLQSIALALPLVRRRKFLLPLVEFADRGITDYNLPLSGPRVPTTRAAMQAALAALQKALRPFALLRLGKMPRELGGQLNPFALLDGTRPSPMEAHHLVLPAESPGFLRSFGKKKRTEIERAGRNLDQLGENRFAIATRRDERAAVLAMIQQAQRVRVPGKGERYVLEDEGYRQFYDGLMFDAETAELSVVSAIWLGDRPVAGLVGVRRGDRYVALRIGVSDAPEIQRIGLGKVLLTRTAEWAIDQGLDIFDFSLGGTALKAWFHPTRFELIEYRAVFNGVGWPRPAIRGKVLPVDDAQSAPP